MTNKWKHQRGQIGLIVLLIMVVMVTVGVSVATRSVSELKLSRQEQESTRALDLAESGIEQALSKDALELAGMAGDTEYLGNLTGVSYTVTQNDIVSGVGIPRGHTYDVVLDGASDMTVNWDQTCPDAAALVVAILSDGGEVRRYAYDACSGGRPNTSNFAIPGGSVTLAVGAGDRRARIKAIYENATGVSIEGTNLPAQDFTIRSWAALGEGTTRAVQVDKHASAYPSIFDYVLFSGDSIIK